MEKKPDNVFLKEYGIKNDDVKFVGGFVNDVYNIKINEEEFILRIGDKKIKTIKDLKGEIDWLNYLKNNNISVCGVQKNKLGKYYSENDTHIAIVIEKAKGEFVNKNSKLWNDKLFYIWGKNIGKMNNLAKNYTPDNNIRRYDWQEDSFFTPEMINEKEFEHIFYEKINTINSMEKTTETYGLTHGDLHHANFTYDGEKMYMFDFDDCSYNYFLHDVAMPIFYASSPYITKDEDEKLKLCEEFFIPFMKGYYEENDIDESHLENIEEIFKFREMLLIIALNKQLDLNDPKNEKYKKYEDQLKNSIKNNSPYIKDFDKVIKKVIKLNA